MRSIWAGAIVTACVTASLLIAGAAPAVAAAGPEERDSLGTVINDAINEDGPLFTASERALIESKCGYRPGEWDGRSISLNNGALNCDNGRKVDDAETRAMLKVVQPRISARISKVMAKPEVQAAIRQVATESARRALQNLADGYRD